MAFEGTLQEFTIRMHGHTLEHPYIEAQQSDTASRKVRIHLKTFDGADFLIPYGATAVLSVDKTDGHKVLNECEIEDSSTIIITLTSQALACPGKQLSQIYIFTDKGDIKTQKFYIHVPKAVYDQDAIKSTDEYGILQDLISRIESLGANVTTENITAALGYTPANEEDVARVKSDLDEKQPKGDYALASGLEAEITARELAVANLNERLGQQTVLVAEGSTQEEAEAWLEESGDTTKLYLMPDKTFWQYKKVTEVIESGGAAYTNRLPLAMDTDRRTFYGGDYNGDGVNDGYMVDTRLSSSGGTSTSNATGMSASGFIPAKEGDILRIKGSSPKSGAGSYINSYNASNALVKSYTLSQDGTPPDWVPKNAVSYTDGVLTVTLSSTYFGTGFDAVRFSGVFDSTAIVTVNEEIKETTGTTTVIVEKWATTGHGLVATNYDAIIATLNAIVNAHTEEIKVIKDDIETGLTDEEKLTAIKYWDKPVFDYSAITLLPTERAKPALTASDRTVDAVYAKYRALMTKYPRYITETNLGKSTASDTFEAVDILRFDFKEPDGLVESSKYTVNETKPKIILMSGVHCEYAGIYGLYYALEEIAENPEFDDIRRNAHIIVVPCSNPFGLTSQTKIEGWQMSHVNANGVAIHNNFGVEHNTYNANASVGEFNYGGTEPYSELETQYIDRLMAENSDAIAFVTCHNYNNDTVFGSLAIWASSATAYMCNLAYRLIDKISKAWHNKYGSSLQEAIDTYKTDALPDGETRLGWAQFSTSAGTEQLNATKYGIQATNLEISDNMRVFSNAQFSSDVMTHGAEVYTNYLRIILSSYNHTDKEEQYK